MASDTVEGDPIEWLRAQAVMLRARPDLWDTPTEAEWAISLADLIDGVLVQYRKWGVVTDEQGQARAEQALLSLGAVARHVFAVTKSPIPNAVRSGHGR